MESNSPQQTSNRRTQSIRLLGAVIAGLAILLILIAGVRLLARSVSGSDGWDVVGGEAVEVVVPPGSTATAIVAAMHDAGVVRSSELHDAITAAGVEDRLQAGTYALTTDMEADAVVRALMEGGEPTAGATFTVIEGWTIDRIIDELADATSYTQAEYRKVLREGHVTSPLLPVAVDDPIIRWEGLLYPAKYPLIAEATPTEILQAMVDEMTERFERVDWSRIDELNISRYEALVLGSLIEWEAGTERDRPLIASVIHNRLATPMRLQIDATVIYALGYHPSRVLAEHLKVDSPYNTYLIDGLPPTPIGTVSAASLEAAVNPVESSYLFYVLGSSDGSHTFAETYEEHQANVQAAKDAGVLP